MRCYVHIGKLFELIKQLGKLSICAGMIEATVAASSSSFEADGPPPVNFASLFSLAICSFGRALTFSKHFFNCFESLFATPDWELNCSEEASHFLFFFVVSFCNHSFYFLAHLCAFALFLSTETFPVAKNTVYLQPFYSATSCECIDKSTTALLVYIPSIIEWTLKLLLHSYSHSSFT